MILALAIQVSTSMILGTILGLVFGIPTMIALDKALMGDDDTHKEVYDGHNNYRRIS